MKKIIFILCFTLLICLSLTACACSADFDECDGVNHPFISTTTQNKDCNGYIKIESCSGCGYYDESYITGDGHHYVLQNEGSTSATCDQTGENYYVCAVCGDSKYESVDMLVHNYVVSTYVAPSCDDEGYIEKTCSKCGDTVEQYLTPTFEHAWTTVDAQEPTCTEYGWSSYQTCQRCGDNTLEENKISALTHDMSEEWTVDVAPTDSECGTRSHHCLRENCNYTEDVTQIPKLGYSDFLVYTVSGNAATVMGIESGYEGDMTILSIPDEYNGVPVKYIAQNAFAGNSDIKILKIPATVMNIYRCAFSGCSNLTTVDIAQGSIMQLIDVEAFSYCYKLAHINLPEGLLQIDQKAFYYCDFTEITVPDSVALVCHGAFQNCNKLTKITLPKLFDSATDMYPDSFHLGFIFGATSSSAVIPDTLETVTFTKITEIKAGAFDNCYGIRYINLPDTVTSIQEGAFDDCGNLAYNVYDGVNYLGNTTNPYLILVSAADKTKTTYELKTAKFICSAAFKDCTSLENITIPDGLTEICTSTFEGCSALENITFCDSIVKIGSHAFDGCVALKALYLPASLENIGSYAFRNCTSLLNQVVIHEKITSIGIGAFHNAGKSNPLNFSLSFAVTTGWHNMYGQEVPSTFLSNSYNVTAVFTNDGSDPNYAEAYSIHR